MSIQSINQLVINAKSNLDQIPNNALGKNIHNVHNIHESLSELDKAMATCEEAIILVADNPTAHLEHRFVAAFRTINNEDSMEYERLRTRLRMAHSLVRVTALDKIIMDDPPSDTY